MIIKPTPYIQFVEAVKDIQVSWGNDTNTHERLVLLVIITADNAKHNFVINHQRDIQLAEAALTILKHGVNPPESDM